MTEEQKKTAETIAGQLSEEALLTQCVEELGELVQVCAKRVRILRGENYTPCSDVENYEKLIEETADVILCLNVLNCKIQILKPAFQDVFNKKLKRWLQRIKK